jgi:hypothetical protein
MPKPAPFITYRELFDRLPTKTELVEKIRGLNAFHTVLLTSRLNAMFRHSTWSRNPEDNKAVEKFQYWFAAAILDLETKQRIESRFGEKNPAQRPVFHPLQFLNVMRLALALAEGDESARPGISGPSSNHYGVACLMVSDLLLSPEEQANLKTGNLDDRRQQLMLQSLASLEISSPTPLRNLLYRSYATYRIILRDKELLERIKRECGGLDIEADFEAHFGVSLMGWLSLAFGAQTVLTSLTQEQLLNKPELFLINRKTILQNCTLTQDQIDSFFDTLSMEFDELRAEIRKERPVDERLDLVPFKSRPFLLVSTDTYACLDFAFVTEKLHNGPYFLLSNKLPENDRGRVFKAWGLLFEAYANWLLKALAGRHAAQFYSDTCWEDGKKSFDAVFVKKRVLVVMEHKGGFLRQDARYSNNLETFTTDLQNKIGVGCTQLARDIGALFPEVGTPGKLRNVSVSPNTLFVLPVLVVQDPMVRTPFINYFLNQRFQSERVRFPSKANVQILPLNVAQITDLEDLVEMAEAFDLDVLSVLHRRCNTNNDMLWELSDVVRSIPDNRNLLSPRFQEVLEKGSDEMCSILFKGFEATNTDTPGLAAADGRPNPLTP